MVISPPCKHQNNEVLFNLTEPSHEQWIYFNPYFLFICFYLLLYIQLDAKLVVFIPFCSFFLQMVAFPQLVNCFQYYTRNKTNDLQSTMRQTTKIFSCTRSWKWVQQLGCGERMHRYRTKDEDFLFRKEREAAAIVPLAVLHQDANQQYNYHITTHNCSGKFQSSDL